MHVESKVWQDSCCTREI